MLQKNIPNLMLVYNKLSLLQAIEITAIIIIFFLTTKLSSISSIVNIACLCYVDIFLSYSTLIM